MSDDCICTVDEEINSVKDAKALVEKLHVWVGFGKSLHKKDYVNWSCAYTWISNYPKAIEMLEKAEVTEWEDAKPSDTHQEKVNEAIRCILRKPPPGPRAGLFMDLEETEQ